MDILHGDISDAAFVLFLLSQKTAKVNAVTELVQFIQFIVADGTADRAARVIVGVIVFFGVIFTGSRIFFSMEAAYNRVFAVHTRRSLSLTAVELIRRGLASPAPRDASAKVAVATNAKTGLPVIRLPRTVTPEDIKELEDEA